MNSKTLQATSTAELNQKLTASINDNFKPTLGLVFNSIEKDIHSIQTVFNSFNIEIVGCTTAGEIIDHELLEESIVVLLLDINPNYYKIHFIQHEGSPYSNAFGIGQDIKNTFDNIGLLMMTGDFGIDASSIVNGLKDGIGKNIPIYGGLAADGLQMTKTFIYDHLNSTDTGSIMLILDTDKIEINGLATSGWSPIGGEKTITRSEGNIVYEIDDERAYDVFIRYFGVADASDSIEQLVSLQTNYPLQITRQQDTILRSPLVLNEETGSITLMGGVTQGDRFRFSNSPGFEIIEQTIEEYQGLKNTAPDVDALVLFSCKGRHGAFGPLLEDEIEGMYNYWNKPMVGFLAYGEIGNTPNGVCEFHNETCVLVTLKEK